VKDLKFKGIGNTTILHLMKNLGMNVFKPDIHVRRILTNLCLIKNENAPILDIYKAMLSISSESRMKLSDLDTILFNYGRINGDSINTILSSRK